MVISGVNMFTVRACVCFDAGGRQEQHLVSGCTQSPGLAHG